MVEPYGIKSPGRDMAGEAAAAGPLIAALALALFAVGEDPSGLEVFAGLYGYRAGGFDPVLWTCCGGCGPVAEAMLAREGACGCRGPGGKEDLMAAGSCSGPADMGDEFESAEPLEAFACAGSDTGILAD